MVAPGQIRHFRYKLLAQSYETPRLTAALTQPFIIDIPADSPACAVFDNPQFKRTELYLPTRKAYTTSRFIPKLKQQVDDYEKQVKVQAERAKQEEAQRQTELEELRKSKQKADGKGGNPNNGGPKGGDDPAKEGELPDEVTEHPVTKLTLHPDTMKVAKTAFATIGDIMEMTDDDLKQISGIGDARLKEIRTAVEAYLMSAENA